MLYVITLLWIAVGAQFIVNRLFIKQGNIMEAFVNTNSGLMESTLEITATYGNEYLTEEDKKSLISYVTSGLGVSMNHEVETSSSSNRQEMAFTREAKRAETTVKVVSVYNEDATQAFKQVNKKEANVTQYIMVRLTIYEDVSNDILSYESKLKEVLKGLEIAENNINTTLQFSGAFAGNLSLDTKNKIADRMINSLQGEIVYENREDNLYTIYGYTGLLNEYITVDNSKINIQVAMTYEENSDRTKIYLATPVISGDW